MPDLTKVKKYLRVDGSEDDDILTLLMDAAVDDLKDSGIQEPVGTTDPRYDLAVMLFVALHFENRDPSMKIDKLNAAYMSLILKLKSFKEVIPDESS
ncbi:head-tail connector protein [Bacillaceae bacterium Marseille-Q3522]|nr:head-tail connector protein [Bacillaceae bacterium Marseille-Q3522]